MFVHDGRLATLKNNNNNNKKKKEKKEKPDMPAVVSYAL